VAQWRTSAALALLPLVAAACGQAPAPDRAGEPVSRPRLTIVQQSPMRLKGTGFRPHERVQVVAKGSLRSSRADATADSSGTFTVSLGGLIACDSVTVSATGSKGTHTGFNLSQIVCADT
jgi:hypothetical protein